MSPVINLVDTGSFDRLFIQQLGWSSPTQKPLNVIDQYENGYTVSQVASYRGMGIWTCPVIPDLNAQRLIDSAVAAKTLERLIIYTDGVHQEWRWPRSSGRKRSGPPTLVSHRHTVGQPNSALLERLDLISIPMGSEITVPELLDKMREAFDREAETASKQAARLMGGLYERLDVAGMGERESSVFLARMLFLMFGDDTAMWKRNLFHDFIAEDTAPDGSDLREKLIEAFSAADSPVKQRSSDISPGLQDLPYINGGIFADDIRMPDLDASFRKALLETCKFDWGQISPAVFGSMFQTVKTREARRHLGEHYTTEKNILKTIEPLFLDGLRQRLDAAWDDRKALAKLHKELGKLQFLDPACGCGNFLIVAYRELRALELTLMVRERNLAAAAGDQKALQLAVDATYGLKVSIDQFHGIEIEAWPARIAETAMFLVDHQANMRMANELGMAPTRLPLEVSPHIHLGNALRMNWSSLLDTSDQVYVFGNPPFLGSLLLNESQKSDARAVWGDNNRLGTMDYVTNWFVLGSRAAALDGWEVGFVSTNSISQGEQVAALWSELSKSRVEISYAHQTFAWSNEAAGQAAVHVVVVGLTTKKPDTCRLFSYADIKGDPEEWDVSSINPYLYPGEMLVVGTRTTPLNQGQTQMRFGSMPRDGGHLSKISPEDAAEIRGRDPIAARYLRPLIGAEELINGGERYCLWLVDAAAAEISSSPELLERLAAVKSMRLESKAASTRRMASTPGLFGQNGQPTTRYLAVPRVSSESRKYVPMAMFDPDIIASDALLTVADADLLTFGLLMSSAFNTWNATVSGRLESRFRISAEITYHNFPYPSDVEKHRTAIEIAAQGVLDAREAHPGTTLAALYGPTSMPKDLSEAHAVLDSAVLAAYGLSADAGSTIVLAKLFDLYGDLIRDGMLPLIEQKSTRKKRSKP